MKPSTQAVLTMLREAGETGVTTGQFIRAYQPRFSARLYELGKLGCEIDSERLDRNSFIYRLTYEPDDLERTAGTLPPLSGSALGAAGSPESVPDVQGNGTASGDDEPEGRDGARLFDFAEIDIPPSRPRLLDPDQETA